MNVEAGGGVPYAGPPSLDELLTLRTDYEDVPVPALGGTVIRVFALSGVARVRLVAEVRRTLREAGIDPETFGDDTDVPDEVATEFAERIEQHQARVVAASMGYAEEEWDALGELLPDAAIETLYGVATRLSGLGSEAQQEERDRLPETRNAASGSD